MKNIKDELQHIILGDGSFGQTGKLEKVQKFLNRHAKTSSTSEKQQFLQDKETTKLITFALAEDLFYRSEISQDSFIGAGAEQIVYRFDDTFIIKTNSRIFYNCWLDYFNSLLLHNYFFPTTCYEFLGFKMIDGKLNAVVKQEFIVASEPTNLNFVRQFLKFNNFENTRNNDYKNFELGLIFEDLHDENVLTNNGVLFFIDTIFYLMPDFYNTSSSTPKP